MKVKIEETKINTKIDYTIIAGIIIGIVVFGILYGYSTLDVSYDGWIYHNYAGESDVIQHYAGWVNYRNSPWSFPLGKASNLNGTIISFTDSIPAVAIICKIFSPLLPETFQYFGIYILICFILQEIAALKLLSLYSTNKMQVIFFSLFFAFSPVIIERSFRHCALASHWIILFALLFLFKARRQEKINWYGFGLLSLLAISIHPYFLPMVMGLLFIAGAEAIIRNRKCIVNVLSGIFINITATALFGIIIGALGSNNPVSDRYGFFSLNLNAIINPISAGYDNWSVFFPVLPQTLGNYDGFNYLGGGIILAIIGIFIFIIINIKSEYKVLETLKRNVILLAGCICFAAFSISNVVTFNDKIIFEYHLPQKVLDLFNIFRASSREFYPVFYLIYLSVFCFIIKRIQKSKWIIAMFLFLISVQLYDIHKVIIAKNNYFTEQRFESISAFENSIEWKSLFDGYDKCYMFDDMGNRELAVFMGKYGIENNMQINNRDSFKSSEVVMVNQSNYDINTIYCTKEEDTYNRIIENIGEFVTTKKIGEYFICIPIK